MVDLSTRLTGFTEAPHKPLPRALLGTAGAVALALFAISGDAVGQDMGGADKGRYTMSPVDNGFVRLDTQTGAMSHCTRSDGRWSCEAMADGGTDVRQEVEKLRKENADLRAEIKRLDDMLGLGDGKRPGAVGPGGGRPPFQLPTEKDVDQALDYFDRMLKRFQDRLKRLEEKPGEGRDGEPGNAPAKPGSPATPAPGRPL